jgi:hypothetical protein
MDLMPIPMISLFFRRIFFRRPPRARANRPHDEHFAKLVADLMPTVRKFYDVIGDPANGELEPAATAGCSPPNDFILWHRLTSLHQVISDAFDLDEKQRHQLRIDMTLAVIVGDAEVPIQCLSPRPGPVSIEWLSTALLSPWPQSPSAASLLASRNACCAPPSALSGAPAPIAPCPCTRVLSATCTGFSPTLYPYRFSPGARTINLPTSGEASMEKNEERDCRGGER